MKPFPDDAPHDKDDALRPDDAKSIEALDLIDREIARLGAAQLPGLADHLRGVAGLIRRGHLTVTRLDEDGMTFEPTEEGRRNGAHALLPGASQSPRGATLTIEEVQGE